MLGKPWIQLFLPKWCSGITWAIPGALSSADLSTQPAQAGLREHTVNLSTCLWQLSWFPFCSLSLCSSQISVLIPLEALLQDHLQLVMKCSSLFSRIVFFFLVFALILVLTHVFFTKMDSVHLNRHIFSSSTITNLSTGLHLCSYFFDSIQLSTLWVRVQDND